VSSKKADISQIKKYLSGELDANAMHQLERRAQDDPFLMDALEGYESTGVKQPQLNELTARLQQRVEKREARIIPWRMLSIAASVIAVLTVGGLWVYNTQLPQQSPLVAQADKAEVKPSPLSQTPAVTANQDSIIKNSPPVAVIKTPRPAAMMMRSRIAANEAPAAPDTTVSMLSATLDKEEHPIAPEAEKKAVTPLDEMLVVNYANQQKAASSKKADTAGVNMSLASRAVGIRVAAGPDKALAKTTLKGKVVSKEDGSPLPGVSVKIAGTTNSTFTDANGGFTLNTDSTKTNVIVAYVGYETQQINARNRDLVKPIVLEPNTNGLNEEVVVGYGSKKAVSKTPTGGYGKYVKDQAISPDGKIGVVQMTVKINSNGTLSDIRVIKSLSPVADKKAIELIKNDPDWTGNANNQGKKVTVEVKFGKAE
jgi:outer membrane biosynthesis protein TonB